MNTPAGYGLIGCGGFGRFCLEQYATMPDLKCVAVADTDPARAEQTAKACGVEACPDPASLLARADIDIVHLATPPFTHVELAMAALKAGKHVLCEKPLAVSLEDGRALLDESVKRGLVLAVNLMMRYNPLCQGLKKLIESRIAGDPVHASFNNDAKDEPLPPDHWFWEPEKSGGIFIEHGVHFFDLFEWWFGSGRVVTACEVRRPGSPVIDQVHCTAVYGDGVLGAFYHGFHQASRRDLQEWMIVFENGTLKMREWVPTSLELDFLATEEQAAAAAQLFDCPELAAEVRFEGMERHFHSRHRAREADGRYRLTVPCRVAKMDLYGHMVRELMQDQILAMRNPGHRPLVDGRNGVSSLAYAADARDLARAGRIEFPTNP